MKEHLKALRGFPFGIMMLSISYLLIYLIDGKITYLEEISKLSDVNYLIAQLVYSGISYIVLFEVVIVCSIFQKNYSKCIQWGDALGFLIFIIIIGIISLIISKILNVKNAMSEEVVTVLIGGALILLILMFIVTVIYQSIEDYKINKVLKEKNKTED